MLRRPFGPWAIGARTLGVRADGFSVDAPSRWHRLLRSVVGNKAALISFLTLSCVVLGCYVGPQLYRTNQTNIFAVLFQPQNLAPSAHHLLGTDNQGFDLLGRLMWAGQWTIATGLLAGLLATSLGIFVGTIMGGTGGYVSGALLRIAHALLMIPYPILLIALCVVVQFITIGCIVIVGMTGSFGIAILVGENARTLSVPSLADAETLIGAGRLRHLRKHVIPGSIRIALPLLCLATADAMLAFAFLDWLGFYMLPPPKTDLGSVIFSGFVGLFYGFWWEFYPALLLLFVVIMCFNVLGAATCTLSVPSTDSRMA